MQYEIVIIVTSFWTPNLFSVYNKEFLICKIINLWQWNNTTNHFWSIINLFGVYLKSCIWINCICLRYIHQNGSLKKHESSRKTSISALLTMPKPLTVWITINSGKFLKRSEYQTTWPASKEICMQVKEQQLKLDMEQWMDWFQIGKVVYQGWI